MSSSVAVPFGKVMVTVPEAARLLSISKSQAYELVAREVIPSKRLGPKCIRVPVEGLQAFANSLTSGRGE